MSIYITGTTRGLGKALEFRLQRAFPFNDVYGLNRPDYNIRKPKEIVEFVKDFDIFVNNAHDGFSQTELLYNLFEANKNRDCIILNIGSVSADGDRKEVNPYAIEKKALDAACTQLQLVPSKCKVMQVKLGRMETDLVKHIDAPKMKVEDVARFIVELLEMSTPDLIKTVTLDIKS